MDLDAVYRYTILLVGIGLTIKAFETIWLLPQYDRRGVFDYAIIGNDSLATTPLAPVFAKLYSKPGVLGLATLGVLAFLALAATSYGTPAYRIAASVLIVVNVAFYYRQAFGLDGADQMSFLILVTVFFCSIVTSDPKLREVGVWFIALQLALSYFVAGAAKLVSKEWRSGIAISGILSTYTYGTRFTRKLLTNSRVLCILICWGVIVTEMVIPFGLLLEPTGVAVALGVGLAMHVSIAIIMGLNDFVWGFAAAYPSFYYIATVA